jgi:hypothetical protein
VTSAHDFIRTHPGLLRMMATSPEFAAVRDGAALDIDDERLYIVRGDTLGDEEELFVEALVRGAQATRPDDPNRAVYLALDDEMREVVDRRVRG